MIKMRTAFTAEIDDPEAAVEEIAGQLDLPEGKDLNRLCLLHCHAEFCESGVTEALAAYLNETAGGEVPLCGFTAASSSVPGFKNDLGLTIALLESPDIRFLSSSAPRLTLETLGHDIDALCAPFSPWAQAAGKEKPAMLLAFLPVTGSLSGERIISEIDKRTGGTPLFGGLSSSESDIVRGSNVVYGGKACNHGAVLVGLYGDIKPEFCTADVRTSDIVPIEATVTKAQGNTLFEIGGVKALEYLRKSGLVAADAGMMHAVPLLFTLEDGSRVIRNPVTADEDTGSITLTGEVPQKASMGLAIFNNEVIRETTEEGLRLVREKAGGRPVILYSCMVRRWFFLGQSDLEQTLVQDILGGASPFIFAYAGGEVLPTRTRDGGLANRLQNESIIMCVL